MVSSTLYPAVHILGSQNMYCRAESIAGHYWPWAVFFLAYFAPSPFTPRNSKLMNMVPDPLYLGYQPKKDLFIF